MDKKENDEFIPKNEEAPPVIISYNQNFNNDNKNIVNNIDKLNLNKQVILDNNINKSQNSFDYMNPYLLQKQKLFHYNPDNPLQLNYNNQIKEKNKNDLLKSINNN